MEEINYIRNKYKQKVSEINLDLKKKYFCNIITNKVIKKISSFDDMYDIINKNKFIYNLSEYDIKKNINIYEDIIKYCKIIFGIKFFDDNDFKCVRLDNYFNYLNPKEGESIIYNSLLKSVFQQKDFRDCVYLFEEKINNLYDNYNNNVRINFYEDEEYEPLVWMIIEISDI